MGEAMIKGGAIREFFAWYQQKFGIERVREMARQAPEGVRELLDPDDPMIHFLPASWYPARIVHAMLELGFEGKTELERERFSRDAARHVVKNGMNSVYRVLLSKLGSPEIYSRMIPRMWRQLHDSGDRAVVITGTGQATSTVANWRGHHALLCLLATDLMCAVFEEMGCRDVKWRRVRCISHESGRDCAYEVTWKK